LREGNVVALKGLGGFHLACDATSAQAVQRLRARKRRPYKPLAIMAKTLESIREHCTVSPEEARLLTSPQCPIVLLPWKGESSVARSVAPGLKYLGVMLPYTPLHHLLLAETRLPLVMTSGNISEEPIAKDNDEALRRLHGIVDYFVLHNRDIHARYDDSVAAVEGGRPQLVRRARGYAPYPIHLPFKARQVLACGAEVKNSFCMTKDSYAFVSQHVGDMENLETLEHFENTIDLYRKLFRLDPEALACDLHPDYLATKYARGHAGRLPLIPVQHHHAHIASCMVDNGLREPVIGVALDGTGYGSDGTIWGGEFLIADYTAFRRVAHLEQVPMPGGAAAIDRPYRMAFSYLYHLLGEAAVDRDLPFLSEIGAEERELLKQQLERNFNCPMTSSCGRLFDGVSAMLGIRDRVDYEGQAAVELEMAATDGPKETKPYPYSIVQNDGVRTVQLAELINAIVEDIGTVSVPEISWRFHHTMAQATAEVCDLIASESGLHRVALSGGVFQNRLMSRLVVRALERRGFQVFTHSLVPTNDGGVSLGQAVVACSSLT
ncbi:MAG: carbamoyltransferase HypF, partial [Chloroflexota bacterium]